MNYAIFKFHFLTAVHLGEGILNSSCVSFMADTLFSSLFIESLKMNMNTQLLNYVNEGKLCFSDSFPFSGNDYFLPKPLISVRNEDSDNLSLRKLLKKIRYLPCDKFDDFVNSKISLDELPRANFCKLDEDTKAAVRNSEKEEPLPFRVGVCTFMEDCGLYVIVGYEGHQVYEFVKQILESLQYTGIGGKRSCGLGRFSMTVDHDCRVIKHLIERDSDHYMTVSVSYPRDDEMDTILVGASYLLIKRSGFVLSETYAGEQRRKEDRFVFSSGSCFCNRFKGTVLNVAASDGRHQVYRYARPMFIGV